MILLNKLYIKFFFNRGFMASFSVEINLLEVFKNSHMKKKHSHIVITIITYLNSLINSKKKISQNSLLNKNIL